MNTSGSLMATMVQLTPAQTMKLKAAARGPAGTRMVTKPKETAAFSWLMAS